MIYEGLLRLIGDIIVSETDDLVLVCLFYFLYFISSCIYFCIILLNYYFILSPIHYQFYMLYCLWFIQKVTLLLSSAIVVEWGLERKDGEEMTGEMIGNILRMIMVLMIF